MPQMTGRTAKFGINRRGTRMKTSMRRRVQGKNQQTPHPLEFGDNVPGVINNSATYHCLTIRITDSCSQPKSQTKAIAAKVRRRNPVRF
jgi:hypothetical protein